VTEELNPITGERVIVAPQREQRPNVYEGAPCPFCPGAENETPPEICRDGDPWRIRVFPNRYPPTEHAEIIVESALHDDTFDALAPDHAQRVVEIYFERYRALAAKAAYVCIFKNDGRMAGASRFRISIRSSSGCRSFRRASPRKGKPSPAPHRVRSAMCGRIHSSARRSTIAGLHRTARASRTSNGSFRKRTSINSPINSPDLASWLRCSSRP
jgi:UDPglucose--hexose-1-phosphate uridylyltransferase